jgi:hypothetical protein
MMLLDVDTLTSISLVSSQFLYFRGLTIVDVEEEAVVDCTVF